MYLKLNWTDMHFRADEFIKAFDKLKDMGVPIWLYAGYGGHNRYTTGNMEADARIQNEARNDFLDYWLLDWTDNGFDTMPPVTYAIYGTMDPVEGSFEYGYAETLPRDTQYLTLYLRENNQLSTFEPGEEEAPDMVQNIIDPEDIPEIPNKAGWVLNNFEKIPDDILIEYANIQLNTAGALTNSIDLCQICYTSDVLEDTFEMTGQPKVLYHLNTDGDSILLATELWDVNTLDNTETLVTFGPVGSKEHEPMDDFSLSHELYSFSYRFLPDHQIKLCISNKAQDELLHWGKGLGNGEGGRRGGPNSGPHFLASFADSDTYIFHESPERASFIRIPVIGDLPSFK